ncbi:exonuclease domain-containing protein [Fructobacillus ficulneus]|uniref:DNA polymerase III polC-type n=1 Tax=Fructobacillus ficulneus TaxID=157463 RepID=A0A0K8MHZ2_9LACO|nr:exonuclease domain-containing protein [Fructobacillus ficulneus]GAP00176.1 Rad3-related DNA helicase [Fructobacillus ficulneus]
MKKSAAFVIVDLETTNPSVEKGGRIIQIGMTFVKNKKIVEHFDSFVNPGQTIDKKIQQLTHITQKDVRDAPFFEEIAPSLQALLQGQVFVAHNVNFDYPYLNAEFARVGLPELDLQALDTVQLAQLLYPTAPGYRLSDLTKYLNLPLTQAHRANADAEATAYLMLSLWQKAQGLAEQTKKDLLAVDWGMLRESQDFLAMAIKDQSPAPDFLKADGQPDLAQTDNSVQSVAKEPTPTKSDQKRGAFPKSLADKQRVLGPNYDVLADQGQVMDQVQQFLQQRQRTVWQMTTPPKVHKTLSYLFPLFYQKRDQTAYLLAHDIGLLNHQERLLADLQRKLDGPRLKTAKLYAPQDYLDLKKYRQALAQAKENGGAFWLARVIVWQGESVDKALIELPKGITNQPAFDNIRSDEKGQVFKQTFDKAKRADVVLMTFAAFFALGEDLQKQSGHKDRPVAILEKPVALLTAIQEGFGLTLPLSFYQDQVARLADQAAFLPNKIQGQWKVALHNWEEASNKIDRQALDLGILKSGKAILNRLLDLVALANKADFQIRMSQADLVAKLNKLAWLSAHQEYLDRIDWAIEKEPVSQSLVFSVKNDLLYQKYFLKQVDKVLVVSSFLPEHLSEFLSQTPKALQPEKTAVTEAGDGRLKTVLTTSRVEDRQIELLVQANMKHMVLIVQDFAAVKHWYYKLTDRYGDQYMVYGQDISAPLVKAARQSNQEDQAILVVMPDYLTTIWQQNLHVPNIAMVSQAHRWLDVAELGPLVVSLQKQDQAVLLGSFGQGQVKALADRIVLMNGRHKRLKANFYRDLLE